MKKTFAFCIIPFLLFVLAGCEGMNSVFGIAPVTPPACGSAGLSMTRPALPM